MKTNRIVLIAIALLIAVGLYAFTSLSNEASTEDIGSTGTTESPEESEQVEQDNEEPIVGDIPSAEEVAEEFPLDLSEYEVQKAIHHMSHQKVAANKKWGHKRITEERIERLIEVVEANNYTYRNTYLDILKRWKAGDFRQAVEDHNRIWRIQGGTVGEATRLFTEKEEAEYIKKHFK
ncbi:DUF6241 domain-containing protein [Alkalihalobacterium elongatum]|uniref:DUF6241 domain-containing protein n=1 Tax=Alkalihalobacterium elongatum TaxID=2675466 RepID=UPI001C1FEF96|nr:DUF6241 domain-containing protein [Alkalihalobacterium elongatum]